MFDVPVTHLRGEGGNPSRPEPVQERRGRRVLCSRSLGSGRDVGPGATAETLLPAGQAGRGAERWSVVCGRFGHVLATLRRIHLLDPLARSAGGCAGFPRHHVGGDLSTTVESQFTVPTLLGIQKRRKIPRQRRRET